jgi:hypothetical protein
MVDCEWCALLTERLARTETAWLKAKADVANASNASVEEYIQYRTAESDARLEQELAQLILARHRKVHSTAN